MLMWTDEHNQVLLKVSFLTAWPCVVPPFHDYLLLGNLWKPQRGCRSLFTELYAIHETMYIYCNYKACGFLPSRLIRAEDSPQECRQTNSKRISRMHACLNCTKVDRSLSDVQRKPLLVMALWLFSLTRVKPVYCTSNINKQILTSSWNSPNTFPPNRRNLPPFSGSTTAAVCVNACTIYRNTCTAFEKFITSLYKIIIIKIKNHGRTFRMLRYGTILTSWLRKTL